MAFAQDRAISGTVYDMGTGQPLAGVTVSYKTQTSLTDSMGSFHLNGLLPNATLRLTYVGYETTEYKLGGETAIRISMKKSDKSMDEVVVIGYGTVKKRDLTGSIYTVKAEDITRSPTSNPLEAVEGMVPGADITQSSGKANATPNIEIRGDRSINGSSTPLYIIDGIQGGNINTLNPNDIESIEFLKDALSTAIYGSQKSRKRTRIKDHV